MGVGVRYLFAVQLVPIDRIPTGFVHTWQPVTQFMLRITILATRHLLRISDIPGSS